MRSSGDKGFEPENGSIGHWKKLLGVQSDEIGCEFRGFPFGQRHGSSRNRGGNAEKTKEQSQKTK